MRGAVVGALVLAAIAREIGLVATQFSDSPVPNILGATTFQPSGWKYPIPAGGPVVYFQAQHTFGSPVTLTNASYMTNPGGAILDVIPGANHTYAIRGYVPAADPYASNTTFVELSTAKCGLAPGCTAGFTADNAPQCALYAVDMAFCGTEGLVTDRDHALVVLACSQAVSGLCAPAVNECIQVLGPSNATLEYVDRIDAADNIYHVLIAWEPSYLGEVTLAVECEVADARGNPLAEPIRALQFTVLPVVAVRSSAYRIGARVLSAASAPAAAIYSHDRPAR